MKAPEGLAFKYKADKEPDELALYECVIRPCHGEGDRAWWMLWMRAKRESDGIPFTFAVPVNPRGQADENGPGGRTWALSATVDPSGWQVSPSINVLSGEDDKHELATGNQPGRQSLWHQTPCLLQVGRQLPWMDGPVPPRAPEPVAQQDEAPVATKDGSEGYAQAPMGAPQQPPSAATP